MKNLLARIQPRLLVATYPVNIIEAQLLYEAKASNIPTLLHLLSWDNITSKGRFPVIADYFILWGSIMQQELQEYYRIDDRKIQVCGVPHFDHYFPFKNGTAHEELLEIFGLNPKAPYLFFAMSAQRFSPYEIDIVEALAQAIENNQLGTDTQLVIRPHPQNVSGNMASQSWLKRLKILKSNRVAIDTPRLLKSNLRWSLQQNDMTYLAKLLAGCQICLNSGSTISIEALLLDKPVIITSFDADHKVPYWKSARRLIDYTHLAKLIALGGISVSRSFADLFQMISTYLGDPDHLQAERRHTAQQQCYQLDGQSTERAVAAIQQTLAQLDA
ncbi:MAG: CDP-glycerol glycerophosphotransferase family protein [Bacteroidota bacterium]